MPKNLREILRYNFHSYYKQANESQLENFVEEVAKEIEGVMGNSNNIQPTQIVHYHENNTDSQIHLNNNREHFGEQCQRVYQAMMNGERISSEWGFNQQLKMVDSMRRARELQASGIKITREWIKAEGKNSYKEYSMTPEQREYNLATFPNLSDAVDEFANS